MKTRNKHSHDKTPKTSPHPERPKTSPHYHTRHAQTKRPTIPPRPTTTKHPQKTLKPPAYTRGEKQKYPDTTKPRNSSFLSKNSQNRSSPGKTLPSLQKQYPIITHENHNQQSCYTAVYCATPTQGAVTRTIITTTATIIITNVFQVIREIVPSSPRTYPLPAEQHTQGLTAIFNK